MQSYDTAIIGGGIVGLATAKALLERRGKSLVVLEAETRLGAEPGGPTGRMSLLIGRCIAVVQESERALPSGFCFADFVGLRTMGWIGTIDRPAGDKHDN